MVENLNKLSFRDFGDILDGPFRPSWGSVEDLVRQPQDAFERHAGQPVYLERVEGMPVVLVSTDGLRTVRRFYLDKPVMLHTGVWYLILFLGEEGCVRKALRGGGGIETVALPQDTGEWVFSSALRLGPLYTLFHQEQERGFFFRGEQHKPYELVYVTAGALHSVAGGQDTLLRKGEMVLYSPGIWHMQYADGDEPVSFVTLSFDMDCPFSHLLVDRRLEAGSDGTHWMERILEEQREGLFLHDDMLLCLLQHLLLGLLRRQHTAGFPQGPRSGAPAVREYELVEQAQRHITDHLDRRLTVAGVARAVNISTSYLSALFRKHLGMPPSRYISRAKLSESKRLLREERQGVTQVSERLGYATVQHFSRCFKAEFGVPPSAYAREGRR